MINLLLPLSVSIRPSTDGSMPQNTRANVSYNIVGYKTGDRIVQIDNHKPFVSEDILQVAIINDAGYLAWVYLSQVNFKGVKNGNK